MDSSGGPEGNLFSYRKRTSSTDAVVAAAAVLLQLIAIRPQIQAVLAHPEIWLVKRLIGLEDL